MKKLLLPLAIGSALSLVGCGSGDEAPLTESEVNVAASRVVFDPSNGALSAPTNILLSGSVDGTLNLPVDDATDSSDPTIALNGLDGWGTHSTLTFDFSLPVDENGEKVTIEASSLEAQGSIRVFETLQGGNDISADCAAANPAAVCAITGELQHGTDFKVKATGDGSVAVLPLRPFKPKTGYLVVLTDNIQDSLGRDVKPSQTYTLMKRNAEENPVSGDESALALQGLVNSYEGALAQHGVDPEGVIYSSNFTTQSVGDVLGMTKTLLGLAQDQGMGPQVTFTTSTTNLDTYVAGSINDPDMLTVAQNTNVYNESITLPYYLHTPENASDTSHLTGRWEAKCDSPVSIVGGIESGAIPDGTLGVTQDAIDADKAAVIQSLVETCIAQPDGIDLPGVDEERHLTRYNPVPEQQSVQNAPVFMTVPAYEAPPAGGWPVVIFQHGIGSSALESAPAIATQLSAAGFITIAIDHPLHGERGFDTDGDNEIDVTATGQKNVTTYMNLQSLLTTRDNLRQSVTDLLALRLGLNNLAASGAPVNPQDVYFLGHSLGAIAGTAFAQLSNQPSGSDALDAAFKVQGASLAMPGGSLANFLLASDSFGPTIKSNLLYSANSEFQAAANEAIAGGTSLTDFYAGFMAQAADEEVAQINATFEQFAFAAQTVVDSGDPVNYASGVAENTPVFLIEADGDAVIPNSVENKPLAGTQPLVGLMQLSDSRPPESTVPVQSEDGTPVSAYASFLGGSHSSLLNPTASAEVTTEMQTQILTWFGSGLTAIPVDNEEVVE